MAQQHWTAFERGLALKKMGNRIMEPSAGGRSTRRTSRSAGTTGRRPGRDGRRRPGRTGADPLATVAWAAGFDSPTCPPTTASWDSEDPVAIRSNRAASPPPTAPTCPGEFADLVVEEQVARSTALQARLEGRLEIPDGAARPVRPQRRPTARPCPPGVTGAGLGATCDNPFQSIIVRAVELVVACEEALTLVERYEPPDPPTVASRRAAVTGPARPRRRRGCSSIATASTLTGPSQRRRSCPRRRRTRS